MPYFLSYEGSSKSSWPNLETVMVIVLLHWSYRTNIGQQTYLYIIYTTFVKNGYTESKVRSDSYIDYPILFNDTFENANPSEKNIISTIMRIRDDLYINCVNKYLMNVNLQKRQVSAQFNVVSYDFARQYDDFVQSVKLKTLFYTRGIRLIHYLL